MSTHPLPAHARILDGAGVIIEDAARDQLARVARTPGCCAAVGLPDLHPGRGIPVGAAFAFRDRIVPALVGGDAGCGVRLVAVAKARFQGDALLRRVEEATAGPVLPDADAEALASAAWHQGPRGLADVPGLPAGLADLAAAEPADALPPSDPAGPPAGFGAQLGTAGGGNHFLELARVDGITDRVAARALGLTTGGLVVLAHSGSRGLGPAATARFAADELTTPAGMAAYLAVLAGACRFAQANRLLLAWRLLEALGAGRASRIAGQLDLTHNTVVPIEHEGAPAWLHRKGAAPADGPTVVLGSRGAPSHVMVGTGQAETLWSVAHGAGRRLGRADAEARFQARHTRASLRRTALGSQVLCDDARLLFAEHPDAYKPIEPVVAALEAAGAARRLARLTPLITVKR
ncbi:MAG: RtcB family protein [Myxococcales bacterium]|nr:RtcB family protein [Myxococcales bacterium]